jgi:hypothetical protein
MAAVKACGEGSLLAGRAAAHPLGLVRQDRQREREARARGDELRHFTWRDVEEDPAPMLADLGTLLSHP